MPVPAMQVRAQTQRLPRPHPTPQSLGHLCTVLKGGGVVAKTTLTTQMMRLNIDTTCESKA